MAAAVDGAAAGAAAGVETPAPAGSKVIISGVEIWFPFKPYGLQKRFMSCVLQSLNRRGDFALLESPTGTGKTLSLLTSLLAWQAKQRQELNRRVVRLGSVQGVKVGADQHAPTPRPPTIIYASRTHSQLSQVVTELKRTIYRPRIVVLSSRNNLCVNPQVRDKASGNLRHTCRALVKAKSCRFKEGVERFVRDMTLSGTMNFREEEAFLRPPSGANDATVLREHNIMDIEELAERGSKTGVCPYFLSRDDTVQKEADMVFMPYNYLVDPTVRAGLGINWENAVVVIDEAHNLEQVCDEAASFSLRAKELAGASDEVDEATRNAEHQPAGALNVDAYTLMAVKKCVLNIEEQLYTVKVHRTDMGVGQPFDGVEALNLFARAGVDSGNVNLLLEKFEQVIEFHGRATNLELVAKAIGRALLHPHAKALAERYYRTYVEEEPVDLRRGRNENKRGGFFGGAGKTAGQRQGPRPRTLHFWCFSPGVALQELKGMGVHSIILTSGTLSPLGSFASQMRDPFPVRLENPHVVHEDQVWVGVVPKGVTGKRLNSSYQNRSNPEYLSDLGNTIANFARQIPDGILVFFPSYSVMETCHEHWQKSGIAARIEKHKTIIVEAKLSSEMGACVERYEELVERGQGAMFFAVCRGKASEGIDFADRRARAVVITGLPYPPLKEPRVVLKRKYLDAIRPEQVQMLRAGDKVLTGNDWYQQQAYRAVNQAIGRVIRHRNDYGAVILCDDRFGSSAARDALSLWLRPRIHVCAGFGDASKELVRFFKANLSKPELNPPRARGPAASKSSFSTTSSSSSSAGSAARGDGAGGAGAYLDRAIAAVGQSRVGVKTEITDLTRVSQAGGGSDLASLLGRPQTVIEYERPGSATPSGTPAKTPSKSLSTRWTAPVLDESEVRKRRLEQDAKEATMRKRLQSEMELDRKRKHLQSAFERSEKTREASEFMAFCKAALGSDSYNRFKQLLRQIKGISKDAGTANVIREATSLFMTARALFQGARDDSRETLLIEFVHYLPPRLRKIYRDTMLENATKP